MKTIRTKSVPKCDICGKEVNVVHDAPYRGGQWAYQCEDCLIAPVSIGSRIVNWNLCFVCGEVKDDVEEHRLPELTDDPHRVIMRKIPCCDECAGSYNPKTDTMFVDKEIWEKAKRQSG